MSNYYEILGVAPDAEAEEIKRAYRNLAREYHPDAGPRGGDEIEFRKISEAYHVLSNPNKRQLYDLEEGLALEKQEEPEPEDKAEPPSNEPEGNPSIRETVNIWRDFDAQREAQAGKSPTTEKTHSSGGGLAQKLKGMLSKSFAHAKNGEEPLSAEGESIEARLRGERVYQFSLEMRESICGSTRELALKGEKSPRLIKVKIPAGVADGDVISIRAPANEEHAEQKVRIRIQVKPDKFIERQGSDIILKLPVTVLEAIEGFQVEIPTAQGMSQVRIPPLSRKESRLRLSGRGIAAKGRSPGDLYVEPYIVAPDLNTAAAKEAARAIEAHYQRPVREDFPKKF